MDDLFSEFLRKLIDNKTKKIIYSTNCLRDIFKVKNKKISESQKMKIVEKIYLISKNIDEINSELDNLQVSMETISDDNCLNIQIPNEISSKIQEEIQFRENINDLLPIFCYLLYLKLLDN